jgi:hypothetical protein
LYQTKFTSDSVIEPHKDCLVVKGFSQQEGIDYKKTNFVRLILSLATRFGWLIHQMDVKSAFLHGDLAKEIYMEQPLSFMIDSTLVC